MQAALAAAMSTPLPAPPAFASTRKPAKRGHAMMSSTKKTPQDDCEDERDAT
jgi:hypothetical protein